MFTDCCLINFLNYKKIEKFNYYNYIYYQLNFINHMTLNLMNNIEMNSKNNIETNPKNNSSDVLQIEVDNFCQFILLYVEKEFKKNNYQESDLFKYVKSGIDEWKTRKSIETVKIHLRQEFNLVHIMNDKQFHPGYSEKKYNERALASWIYISKMISIITESDSDSDSDSVENSPRSTISPYQLFIRNELKRLRKQEPNLSNVAYMGRAAENWKIYKESRQLNTTKDNVNGNLKKIKQ